MTDRDRQSLLDIAYCADQVQQYLSDKTQAELEQDTMLQDAIVRRLEIVGEAARRLSDDARNELSHLRWSQIIGMQDIIIHQCDRINLDFLWQVATNDLPQLARQLAPHLRDRP